MDVRKQTLSGIMVDIAVVGAGLAGLVCARHLQQIGYTVAVIEKSRGLGGRLATRRLAETWADHGVRYLDAQGPLTEQLLDMMRDRAIVHPWTTPVFEVASDGGIHAVQEVQYVAETGITTVAKALAEGLDIHRGQRVVAIAPDAEGWCLTCDAIASDVMEPIQLSANVLVLTIPAPQALDLVKPLADYSSLIPVIQALQAVEFDPCITTIAAYDSKAIALEHAQAFQFSDHPTLSWASIEASKSDARLPGDAIAVVVQSGAEFAAQHLDDPDLMSLGRSLLADATAYLNLEPMNPDVLQVHRWRYAFCRAPHPASYFASLEPELLLCGGDWCGGHRIEDALTSGLQIALAVNRQLDKTSTDIAHPEDLQHCLQLLL